MRCAPLMLQCSPHFALNCLGCQRQFRRRTWCSAAGFRESLASVCLSFALMLFMLLAPLTSMLLARLVPEEALLPVMGFIVLALVGLVLIASAIATENLWRWIGARKNTRGQARVTYERRLDCAREAAARR